MECACINYDGDEGMTRLGDKIVTARKPHTCIECGRDIVCGERYRTEKTLFEGVFEIFKTCLDCNSVREHLVCSFYYGGIWEMMEEAISDGEDISWVQIGKLTPVARARVCEYYEYVEKSWEEE